MSAGRWPGPVPPRVLLSTSPSLHHATSAISFGITNNLARPLSDSPSRLAPSHPFLIPASRAGGPARSFLDRLTLGHERLLQMHLFVLRMMQGQGVRILPSQSCPVREMHHLAAAQGRWLCCMGAAGLQHGTRPHLSLFSWLCAPSVQWAELRTPKDMSNSEPQDVTLSGMRSLQM